MSKKCQKCGQVIQQHEFDYLFEDAVYCDTCAHDIRRVTSDYCVKGIQDLHRSDCNQCSYNNYGFDCRNNKIKHSNNNQPDEA